MSDKELDSLNRELRRLREERCIPANAIFRSSYNGYAVTPPERRDDVLESWFSMPLRTGTRSAWTDGLRDRAANCQLSLENPFEDYALPGFAKLAETHRDLLMGHLSDQEIKTRHFVDQALVFFVPTREPQVAAYYSGAGPALADIEEETVLARLDSNLQERLKRWIKRHV